MKLTKKEIEELRSLTSDLFRNILRHKKTGGLLPYDWYDYGYSRFVRTAEILKIDPSDGCPLEQDKEKWWGF